MIQKILLEVEKIDYKANEYKIHILADAVDRKLYPPVCQNADL